ncbi:MAG: hopanoid biosynthesis-associated protein HpnK [Candidatus Binataceae bacterium]
MKQLIVNGDDFGLSAEVNAGIVKAHRAGILTSTSLMVAEEASAAAALLARENPGLDVGLHVVVCRGRSVLAPEKLGGVVDAAGRFPENPEWAGMRWFFDRKTRAGLAAEIRAQVEKHLELVGRLDHIDGHLNFHVHPVIADIVVELASEYKVGSIRLPREKVFSTLRLRRDHALRKLFEAVIFRSLSRRTRRLIRERGIKSTDWLYGLHQSGHLSEDYILRVIERLRDGPTELYFHPAADIGGTPPAAAAQLEVEILTSPKVRAALDAHSVRLTTFRELAQDQP